MDNYRHPMYNHYNRNMVGNQNRRPNGCYTVPVTEGDCCGNKESNLDNCIDSLPLAMAYVPMQKFRKVYEACEGLSNGTIFEELNLPYYAEKNFPGSRGGR
jgi:hypothetical protein